MKTLNALKEYIVLKYNSLEEGDRVTLKMVLALSLVACLLFLF